MHVIFGPDLKAGVVKRFDTGCIKLIYTNWVVIRHPQHKTDKKINIYCILTMIYESVDFYLSIHDTDLFELYNTDTNGCG